MADIIIVEDDEIVSKMVDATLSTRGHTTVEVVTNGDHALDAIRDHHPDMVVLDCALPGKSGLLVLKELRDSETFRSMPVLILSARRSDWYVNLALKEGADDYVKKPVHPVELIERVERLLVRAENA